MSTALVVDDSLTVRMDLAEALEGAGLSVVLCATLAEARAALEASQFALILLDVVLPDGDGISLLEGLRAHPKHSATPVMMLSSEAEVRDRIRGLTTGADEYIGKPYQRGHLVARARQLLRRDVRQHPASARTTVLVIDDSPTFREALGQALREADYEVLSAASGEAGLELAAEARPAAIIVDHLLPGIDGASFVRRVRLDVALRRTPCLMLTGSDDVDTEVAALDAGADAFVRKDEDLAEILARLSAVLRRALPPVDGGAASLVSPKKILAVDDSPTYLAELSEALVSDGYEVLVARSGEEALQLLAVQPVDCVLLDLMMPGIGGHETCRRIKAAAGSQQTPLIMLTSMEDRASMIQGLEAGADDYIAKSSELHVLRARVLAQLRRRQFEDENRRYRDQLLRNEHEAAEAKSARELAEVRAVLVRELEGKNKDSERKYRQIVETAQEGIWVVDGQGVTSFANHRMAQMMGVAPGELLGRPLTDFYLGGPSWVDGRSEARFRRADGSEFWASLAVNRIATEVASGALAMVTDITEQRRLQEQLMVADRMASVGTLAAGVAHEINNPLAVVLANLDLAASELAKAQPDLAQVSDGLRDALEAGARVQGVVRDLKVFSRAGDDEVSQQVDVHRVVESSLRLASTEIRHRATLVRDLQPVPMVEGNEGRLGQVLLNLLVNAAQAIGEGKPDRNEIRVATRLDDKGRVEISIADTGPGMTLAVQRQLFMPFFTTKPRGIGTGLGLSICSRLVKAMGGEIACESEVGKGTCFRVALEMARGAAAAVGAPPAQIPAATRRGKVLAIDDEPMLLRIIRRSLEPMHEVVTVGSAVEALARLEKGERYDVILCDLMMPQMTGVELHAALLRLDPSIARQMVFLTGGVFTAEMRTFLDDAPNARVEKPFNMTMLKSLVAGRLG